MFAFVGRCDRIIWFGEDQLKQHSYERGELKLSDHRPVKAIFSTQVKVTQKLKALQNFFSSERSFEHIASRLDFPCKDWISFRAKRLMNQIFRHHMWKSVFQLTMYIYAHDMTMTWCTTCACCYCKGNAIISLLYSILMLILCTVFLSKSTYLFQ